MEDLDRKLLNLVQKDFPLSPRPFKALGEDLGLTEEEVLRRLQALTAQGILRQIGAIFHPQALGYQTTLVAAEIPAELEEQAASVINAHPGVSHNYLRAHRLNFWFTIAVPPGKNLKEEVSALLKTAGAKTFLLLPIKRVFRIAVVFDLEEGTAGDGHFSQMRERVLPDERTIRLVRTLQEPLPLTPRPFEEVALPLGMSEEEVLSWIREMLSRGVMRRFAGLVRHRKAGFRENVMVAWQVAPERTEEVGLALAREPGVTHCYERKSYPHWPYNLYTMIHAKKDLTARIAELSRKYDLPDYLALRTLREYKKVRLKLFIEEDIHTRPF